VSKYWVDLTTADFARLPKETVALLPVAAVEQHGPHLPVGTDTMINRGIVAEALEILGPDGPVLVLPEQAVGTSFEHEAYPGTLSHEATALMGIWTAIFDSVRASGIRRALLFNSHGGQAALLQPTAVALRRRGMLAAYTSWFWTELPRAHFPEEEWRFGYHGGAIETAMMLHLRPDLVVTSEIRDFPSAAKGIAASGQHLAADPGDGYAAGFGWLSQDLNPYGAMGDARLATAAIGKALVGDAAGRLAGLVHEVSRLPLQTLANRTFLVCSETAT
jgi:creatinine amidohydrolase